MATGGGIDPYNVYKMQITSTGPGFGDNTRLLLQPDGYGASPVGWLAGARNDTGEDRAFKIGAICARAQLFLPLVRD